MHTATQQAVLHPQFEEKTVAITLRDRSCCLQLTLRTLYSAFLEFSFMNALASFALLVPSLFELS